MALPKYDAEASLYTTNRFYRGARHGSTLSVGATVVAQHDPCDRGGGAAARCPTRALPAGAAASPRQAGGASCARPPTLSVHEGDAPSRRQGARGAISVSPDWVHEFRPDLVDLDARQLFPPERGKELKMTTPGFTAEASLCRASGRYRQVSLVPAAAAGLLGMAQLELPVLRPPVQPAQPMAADPLRYGRYCGIGHSGSGVPIDAVDEVCCRHDKCYCERGYFDCSCDRNLILNMPGAIADSNTSAAGRAKGIAIAALLAADPFCLCHRWCVPWLGCRDAPFPIPGLPPLKVCTPPYA